MIKCNCSILVKIAQLAGAGAGIFAQDDVLANQERQVRTTADPG
jgi:hypothetical protein